MLRKFIATMPGFAPLDILAYDEEDALGTIEEAWGVDVDEENIANLVKHGNLVIEEDLDWSFIER